MNNDTNHYKTQITASAVNAFKLQLLPGPGLIKSEIAMDGLVGEDAGGEIQS